MPKPYWTDGKRNERATIWSQLLEGETMSSLVGCLRKSETSSQTNTERGVTWTHWLPSESPFTNTWKKSNDYLTKFKTPNRASNVPGWANTGSWTRGRMTRDGGSASCTIHWARAILRLRSRPRSSMARPRTRSCRHARNSTRISRHRAPTSSRSSRRISWTIASFSPTTGTSTLTSPVCATPSIPLLFFLPMFSGL